MKLVLLAIGISLACIGCDFVEKQEQNPYPTRVEVANALKQRDAAIEILARGIEELQKKTKEKGKK